MTDGETLSWAAWAAVGTPEAEQTLHTYTDYRQQTYHESAAQADDNARMVLYSHAQHTLDTVSHGFAAPYPR